MQNDKHYCYILKAPNNKTYNGYTTNPGRRLRQHNQELVGGAKYTRINSFKDWEMIVLITGFPNIHNALQCEWRIKHVDNKKKINRKYLTPNGKIEGLNEILKSEKWTNNSIINSENLKLVIWIVKEYAKKINLIDVKPNIELIVVQKLDLETLANILK